MSPQQIHDIGLAEVERLKKELLLLLVKAGASSPSEASSPSFSPVYPSPYSYINNYVGSLLNPVF